MMMVSMFTMVMYERMSVANDFSHSMMSLMSTDFFVATLAGLNRVHKIRTVAGKMPSLDNRFFKRLEQA